MKLVEFILKLQEIQKKHGDDVLVGYNDCDEGGFCGYGIVDDLEYEEQAEDRLNGGVIPKFLRIWFSYSYEYNE